MPSWSKAFHHEEHEGSEGEGEPPVRVCCLPRCGCPFAWGTRERVTPSFAGCGAVSSCSSCSSYLHGQKLFTMKSMKGVKERGNPRFGFAVFPDAVVRSLGKRVNASLRALRSVRCFPMFFMFFMPSWSAASHHEGNEGSEGEEEPRFGFAAFSVAVTRFQWGSETRGRRSGPLQLIRAARFFLGTRMARGGRMGASHPQFRSRPTPCRT